MTLLDLVVSSCPKNEEKQLNTWWDQGKKAEGSLMRASSMTQHSLGTFRSVNLSLKALTRE
jgi:hypothetical protein